MCFKEIFDTIGDVFGIEEPAPVKKKKKEAQKVEIATKALDEEQAMLEKKEKRRRAQRRPVQEVLTTGQGLAGGATLSS